MRINTLNELEISMPTQTGYGLVREYISRGGKRDREGLNTLAIRMPTEESYQMVREFARRLA